MRRISCKTVSLGCAIALTSWSAARAQVKLPPGGKALDETGVVMDGTKQGMLLLKNGAGAVWSVLVDPRDTTVHLEGTAEPDFLHPGVSVRLTAEVDKKGAIKDEIKDLEIYSPPKPDYGAYASEADEKPVKSIGEGGKFYLKGRVKSYKAGALVIAVGTKIYTGKLAASPSIKVKASDLSFAQPEDTVKVTGWYYAKNGPGPNKPGFASGSDVSITLAKPLSGATKKSEKPSRSSKTAHATAHKSGTSDKPPIQDPFGPAVDKK